MSVPAAYLGVILIWSTTPLAIQWSTAGGGFLFALAGRMVIGAALCAVLVSLSRQPLAWNAAARRTYLAAGLGIYGAMVATYWSSQFVPSGVIALMFGLTPLFTGLAAHFLLSERAFTPGKIAGIALGFGGLLGIFGTSAQLGPNAVHGLGALLAAVFFQSASMVVVKRFGAQVDALHVTTGALYLAVPLFVLTWWFAGGGEILTNIPTRAIWAIVYLGVFGSVVGFALYFYTIRHLATGTIALITLITPVLALFLGQALNGEHVTAALVWGAGLILCGLVMHQWGDVWLRRVMGARA
jgi:drug/metabolite transporter (DMT)-like permease